jgi:DNA-binding transcriptional LysR family regulator
MLDELHHFLLVVDHGTVTAAARRAHLSQPALSASLQRLEAWAGAPLLFRARAGCTPTAEGQALLPHARAALAEVDAARRAVSEVAGLERGSVRLGAGTTACTYLLPDVLASYRRNYPSVRTYLREAANEPLWEGVASGELDIALLTDVQPDLFPGLAKEPWRRDELVVVARPGDLGPDLPWVSFPRGSAVRALLERHFPGADVVIELASIAALKGHALAGVGRCLVSRAAVREELAAGTLAVLPTPAISRQFVLVHRGADRLPPAASAMRALLRAGC